MRQIVPIAIARMILIFSWLLPSGLHAATRAIDGQQSVITVRVYKKGLFSVFAHDHEIKSPIARGEIEPAGSPSVEFWVDAAKIRVADRDVSEKDRADIQRTMEGPEVLDIRRFPAIHFRSKTVEKTGPNHWSVRGELELHGEARPVTVEVSENDGRYVGTTSLSQRDFGINPVRIAGGTVKVKDVVKIEFEVVTR